MHRQNRRKLGKIKKVKKKFIFTLDFIRQMYYIMGVETKKQGVKT
jgi:hypothetical protein